MSNKTALLFKLFAMVQIIVVIGQSLAFSNDRKETLHWETDWNKALKEAAQSQRPVLMDFYTDWCPPCKKLAGSTFTDKTMIDYFYKENYVLIKVNPEKDRIAEEKFKVYSYPTLLIFNTAGVEIDRILGFRTAADLIKALEDIKKGIGTLEDLLRRLEKVKDDRTKDSFELRWEVMSKYIASADYPQALAHAEKIIELDRDNSLKQASLALYQKGYIHYKWKKYKKALEILTGICETYPNSDEAEEGYADACIYSKAMEDPQFTKKLMKDFVKKFPKSKYTEPFRKIISSIEGTQEK